MKLLLAVIIPLAFFCIVCAMVSLNGGPDWASFGFGIIAGYQWLHWTLDRFFEGDE